MLLGNSAGARLFFDKHRGESSADTEELILRAFAVEVDEGPQAAVRVLAALVLPGLRLVQPG
jgi:hypothetical protein